jgi:hypothetical protein
MAFGLKEKAFTTVPRRKRFKNEKNKENGLKTIMFVFVLNLSSVLPCLRGEIF